MLKKVLTIAGSDSSGGAGIQADIKTITVHKMYAMSAVTALTAQNTVGVQGIFNVSPEFVGYQLDSIFSDIFPDSVKIGMVPSGEIIDVVAQKLKYYGAKNIVLDPVMMATSGSRLMLNNAKETLKNILMPMCDIITPNIPESEALSGMKINSRDDMEKAALKISLNYNGAILVKGGHLSGEASDLLYSNGSFKWFTSERIDNPNTHGTGCTLSSAIACGLAKGYSIQKAVERAKKYLTGALDAKLNLGGGSGPVDHMYNVN